jgi:PPOX class probable F420-dependent enzyme
VGTIPDSHADLLNKKGFAHVSTTMPDGGPHSAVVWFDWDGEHILVSTKEQSRKVRNAQRDPRVAVIITDPENPYRYLELWGRVERIDPDPEAKLADVLSEKYTGQPFNAPRPDEGRVRVAIRPERSFTWGS